MIKFDLLKEMPRLDIATLNFVWDGLWRQNSCSNRSNESKRTAYAERERIMRELEWFANKQEAEQQ